MDIKEINEHIRKLKCEETSWQSVEKLAALCTVRNELDESKANLPSMQSGPTMAAAYSTAAEQEPQSDFVEAASTVPFSGLMRILDEHMNAIRLVYPKEYQLVIKRLKELVS